MSSSNPKPGPSTEPAPTRLPTSSKSRQPTTPRDARIIALILASMGVESAQEGVVRMLMEFAHRYTSDILSDAIVFCEHAGKAHAAGGPDVEDVRLAVQAKTEHSMAGPLTKDFLLTLADTVNRNNLPPLPERYGIRLPPEKDRLTASNFDILPLPPPTAEEDEEDAEGEEDDGEGEEESDVGMEEVNGIGSGETPVVNGGGAGHKRALEEDDDYD